MRKISVAITTLALALVMSLSSLFGCKLITTNTERDMNQVVATIQIDESAPKKTIYKRDLVVKYLSYAYSGQTSSSSNAELFGQIIDELINDAVMVQYAMNYLADLRNSDEDINNDVSNENKWKVETYLSDDDKVDARYSAYLEFDSFINQHLTENDEVKTGDSLESNVDAVRVVPTGAENDFKLDSHKKDKLIKKFNEKLNKDSENFENDKYNAFIKAMNELKANNLIGDEYIKNDIESTEYFKELLTSYQEEILLVNFQETFENIARKTINYDDLVEKYNETYLLQKEFSTSEFESALSGISADKPILKGQAGYGMVYHVLLKADDSTAAKLEEIKEDYGTSAYENATYSADRAKLFAENITARDQRKTWIQSHYDFDGTYFTGDYTLCESDPLKFYGSTTHINAKDVNEDDYTAKYRVNSVKQFSLEEFIELVYSYVYGETRDITIDQPIDSKEFTANNVNPDYENRIKELMFAFSQDDSETALNTYKGYAIKPTPDATEEEEWMLEFAEEGRGLISKDQKTFKVVATDYGYHVMFYAENFANYDLQTLEDYLNYHYGEKDWKQIYNDMIDNWYDYEDTDNLLYILQNSLSATYVNNEYAMLKQDILRDFVYNSNKVVKYEDAYKDLLKD